MKLEVPNPFNYSDFGKQNDFSIPKKNFTVET